jgi:type IX secretion system PorP/SprF family membrane protein
MKGNIKKYKIIFLNTKGSVLNPHKVKEMIFLLNLLIMIRFAVLCILFLSLVNLLRAQDIHFTNYSAFPLNLSPSYVGFLDEDVRCGAGYRQQWRVVPVNYRTLSGWGDLKIRTLFTDEKKYVSAGVVFNNDKAGDLRYGSTQFLIPIAFHLKTDSGWHFSTGMGFGVVQTGFDASRITTDSQFDGYQYNTQLLNGETFQYNQFYSIMWNFGAGVLFNKFKHHTAALHLALHHPHNPKISFQEGRLNYVDPRFTFIPSYTFQPRNTNFNLQTEFLIQFQGKYKEWVPKTGVQYFLQPAMNQSLLFHVSTRLRDAVMLHASYTIKSWYAGISYDLNLSQFRVATSGRGAWEVFVIKTFRNSYTPLIRKKPCPVFI